MQYGGEPEEKRRYEAFNSYSEIKVSYRHICTTLVTKNASAVCLMHDKENLALYKPVAGVRIPNEQIILQNGVKVPWTIGAYLQKARKGADKVFFGVGLFEHLQVQVMLIVCVF